MKKHINTFVLIIFVTCYNSFATNNTNDKNVITFSVNNLELKQRYNKLIDNPITIKNYKEMLELSFYGVQVFDNRETTVRVLNFIKLNQIELEDPYLIGLYKMLEGHIFFSNKNYRISKKYFQEALFHFIQIRHKELTALCYDNMATTESMLKNTILSLEYVDKAIKIFNKIGNHENAIDIYFNQSVRLTRRKEWKKSKTNALKAIKYIKQYGIKEQRLKYLYNKIAYCNIQLGIKDSIKPYINKALKHTNKNYVGSALRRIYYNYALYYELIEKKDSAIYYHKKTFDHFLAEIKFSNEKTSEFQRNQYLLNQDILKKNKEILKKNKLVFFIVMLFLVISIITVFMLYRLTKRLKFNIFKRKELTKKLKDSIKKINENNLKLSEQNNEISTLLNVNQNTLFSKALRISTYNDTIQNLTKKIDTLLNTNEEIKHSDLFQIEKTLNSLIDEKDIWEDFKIQFENVRKGFFENLKDRTPKLTVNDLKHCAYVATKLSTKEVSNLINASPRSVETSRYRIKKKIGLSKEQSLYDYLNSV